MQGTISLYDLLQPDFKSAEKIGWKDAETEKEMQKIRMALEAEISGLEWDKVKSQIYQQLDKLLDVSLGAVLARAWVSSRQVSKVIEQQNEKMIDEITVVPLLDHKVQSIHEPNLKIMLSDTQIGQLPLMVKFAFSLNGILLKIQFGKVQSILAGKCKGVSSLSYQGVILQEKQIEAFDLPNEINVIKTRNEQMMEESAVADDITTETRLATTHSTVITSEENIASIVRVSFAKKVILLMTGLFISFLLIIAIMLFL